MRLERSMVSYVPFGNCISNRRAEVPKESEKEVFAFDSRESREEPHSATKANAAAVMQPKMNLPPIKRARL